MNKNQIKNLKKLAKYLYNLPDDYQHFDMSIFCGTEDVNFELYEVSKETYSQCGAVACALGHGIAAGIKPYKKAKNWEDYSYENFGISVSSEEWDWCFTVFWNHVDNTPKGAAKRIMLMLESGIPETSFYIPPKPMTELYKDYIPVFEN